MRLIITTALALFAALICKGQIVGNKEDIFNSDKINCSLLESIEATYFSENAFPATMFDTSNLPKKVSNHIIVSHATDTLTFSDDSSNNGFMVYEYSGFDKKTNRVLIVGLTYNMSYYYLVNTQTLKVDTLIGNPFWVGGKLVCLEGSYTDGSDFIEIWTVSKNEFVLTTKISFKRCGISPYKITLSKVNELLIKDIKGKYWKYKLR
jgi:hypothetical protein